MQGNKGKVLAYWRLGQLLLQPINLAEAEAVQQKMDVLSHMANEKTFQRWWRASEGYLRWLFFQRCWITKEASVAKSRNADLMEYARESNDDAPASLGDTLKQRAWQQGDRALHEKRWQDAQASYHEALRLARTQEHMKAQALLLGCLGFCYAAAKNFPEGIACFQQALSCFRSLGETRNELRTQLNLSTLFLEIDALAEAHVHLGEALDLSETLEDHLFESVALRKMGETYCRGDETSEAKRFLGYALEAARLQENQQEEGSVLTTLGVVCLELGHTKKAIEYFQQAQTLSHHLGERPSEWEQQCLLAIAYAILGRFDQSRKCFHEAQETFQDTIYEGQVNVYIGLTYFFQENQPLFLAHVKGVLDLVPCEHEAYKRVNQLIHQLTQE